MTTQRSESRVFKHVLKFNSAETAGLRRLFARRTGAVGGVLELSVEVVDELENARREAEALVAAARAEAEEIRTRAYQEGQTIGHREVLEELAKVRLERERLRESAREDMLNLAFQVAKRVVRHEVERDGDLVVDLLQHALEFARGSTAIEVRINPEDRHILDRCLTRLESHVDGVKIHFLDDPSLIRGDCVVETESGVIDARLDTQLEAMKKGILE